MINKTIAAMLVGVGLVIIGCTRIKPGDVMKEDTAKAEQTGDVTSVRNVLKTLPDKKFIVELIKENKIEYNTNLLNDPNKVGQYSIELARSLNLGVYGADLFIARSFDQTQESLLYLKCVNILASHLEVNQAFNESVFDRIDVNQDYRDSVLAIATEAFNSVDALLKTNNRPATSAIILAGCWIEGFYVSCQMTQKTNNESGTKAVLDQKESLRYLIAMLDAVELDQGAGYILTDLRSLYEVLSLAEANRTGDNRIYLSAIVQKITDLRYKITGPAAV